MNYLRAVLSGAIGWLCLVITFYILENIPLFKQSLTAQGIIAAFSIVFYAWFAAWFYYKKAEKKMGTSSWNRYHSHRITFRRFDNRSSDRNSKRKQLSVIFQ